jgi:hypothetical protein
MEVKSGARRGTGGGQNAYSFFVPQFRVAPEISRWQKFLFAPGELILMIRMVPVTLAAIAVVMLCGCRVSTHENGENKNVDIGTPFGSVQVKTNDKASEAAIGIAQYPGAVPVKDGDGDNSAADVNMSFGSFHLGVKAASFQTGDGQDKVLAFYRSDLSRYGEVLECSGHSAVGEPRRTSLGLTCDENKDAYPRNIQIGTGLELRTGSPQKQHIVALETKDGGTRIKLVALDLPSHFSTSSHDRSDSE